MGVHSAPRVCECPYVVFCCGPSALSVGPSFRARGSRCDCGFVVGRGQRGVSAWA